MIFAKSMIPKGVEIEVLESPAVGIIGVGEGSTPALKGFFDSMGIEEAEWMPQCHATYKCGITFDQWSTRPGYESYFHPFASVLDNLTMPAFVKNVQVRMQGVDVHAHPDRFFLASYLARQGLAPLPNRNFPFALWYGYHFDATLLGKYLHGKAIAMGVRYKSCHIDNVNLDAQGNIASVRTQDGETIAADFFVDCSGFAALLIQQALKTPFLPFASNLFNDSAVAIQSPLGDKIPSETVSTALKHGWAWKIPLTSRFGNGYVYSSSHCSADAAETELRERLGLLDADVPARHLKMKVGRVSKHWNKNCLAVGLAQGFIEPLEATALLYVQRTASSFIEFYERGPLNEEANRQYNDALNQSFEGTRDYIVTHYKTNSRTDTEYWRANAANTHLSDPLKALFGKWLAADPKLPDAIRNQTLGAGYPVLSWYCIMAGMGILPSGAPLRPMAESERVCAMEPIDQFLQNSALNFRDQREVLQNIPAQPTDPLRIYLW